MAFLLGLAMILAGDAASAWHPLEIAHCENVFQLSASVYSGAEPHGEEALKALADRGIKTIVSVDGAKPDVAAAEKYGIRYVHLPIGYDGISRERGLQFGRVLTDLPGPVYFHCHHGMHRGPAAVAAGMETSGQWTPAQASAFLKAAGTSPKYTGLYAFVNEFTPPDKDELAAVDVRFPEIADLPAYQESMAVIDRRKDNLALAEKSGWKTPSDHPDISPSHEALQLREMLGELSRLPGEKSRPAPYVALLEDAVASATLLEAALDEGNREAASRAFAALGATCSACHDAYRN